jgi:hypothetical protein
MLKRITLTAVFVVSAAIVGVSVAKAHGGTKAKTVQVDMTAQGFCPNFKC